MNLHYQMLLRIHDRHSFLYHYSLLYTDNKIIYNFGQVIVFFYSCRIDIKFYSYSIFRKCYAINERIDLSSELSTPFDF